MDRMKKVTDELKKAGADLAVLVSPSNVTYAGDYEVPYWPAFMGDMCRGLPMAAACIGAESGVLWNVISDFYKSRLERAGKKQVICYPSFSHIERHDPAQNFKKALLDAVRRCIGTAGRITVGIEEEHCPQVVLEILREAYPDAAFVNISGSVERARYIKTPEEIALLERAARIADAAQERLYEISRKEGDYTELDIWFEVQKAVSGHNKSLTPFVGELVSGPRAGLSDYPLGPSDRKVERGDIAIMDISPRVEGYWADCSNAVVFWEEPDEEQRRYFSAVKDVYDIGREAVYPGVTFREVNLKMEEAYKKNGFRMCSYQGHQIGASVNEKPRFTYHDNAVLEENMVVCIEPQLYTGPSGKTGVRLERMLHVTKDGARELNHFRWGM
ncbi:M24 family metallopeptidase [[Clostridium] hylemonae]|uniref:M24 family metallopeptidase n=1 Tax=[Clostridium] hylemonae TaxID=89153 RepID=UPI001106E39B|nr:Xaa-Pro peptidase family protein [[Clostridium] hylemonae]